MGDSAEQAKWRQIIRSLFDAPAADFAVVHRRLSDINRIYFEELARTLGPTLNAEAQRRPHVEMAEKRELASWVNYVLRELRLALVCPKTGKAAILVADFKDAERDSSRFRFEIRDDNDQSQRTGVSYDLPVFRLREDRPRQHGTGKFHRR